MNSASEKSDIRITVMLKKIIMVKMCVGMRHFTVAGILVVASLLLYCADEPYRSRPYVYFPELWGSWSLFSVWYYGEEDTCSAVGTGTLELTSFGTKFGDEHYSLDLDIGASLSNDTLVIKKTETGIYYGELDSEGIYTFYFSPDSGPDWHSAFYPNLTIYAIPVNGGILEIQWLRAE